MPKPFTKETVIANYFKGVRNSRKRAEEYCFSRMQDFEGNTEKQLEIISTMREIHNCDTFIEDLQQEFYRRINEDV